MSKISVRRAVRDDTPGMSKVRVDTWRATYQGILPEDLLAGLSYQSISERWERTFWIEKSPGVALFVAENEHKEIVGISICGPEQSHDPIYLGEIFVLYVLPQYQNRGIGRRLVAECVQHLIQELSMRTMLVWVIAENPYREFYVSLGGHLVREKTKEIGGKTILEFGYGWEAIESLANMKRIDVTNSPAGKTSPLSMSNGSQLKDR